MCTPNSPISSTYSVQLQASPNTNNGEISQGKIEMAGMDMRRVRLANLPPETPDEAVRLAFSQYGEIKEM